MRAGLWPDAAPVDDHFDITDILASHGYLIAVIALDGQGDAIGFADVALRHHYNQRLRHNPVIFVEGPYVAPIARRHGVAGVPIGAAAA